MLFPFILNKTRLQKWLLPLFQQQTLFISQGLRVNQQSACSKAEFVEWNKNSYIITQKGKQGTPKVVSHQGQDKTQQGWRGRVAESAFDVLIMIFSEVLQLPTEHFRQSQCLIFFLWLSHFCHDLCQRKSRHKNLLHKGDDLIINPGAGASHVTAQVCLSSYLYLRENLLALAGS